MTISEIEKKFNEQFVKWRTPRNKTKVAYLGAGVKTIKDFLRAEISALLESLKGNELNSKYLKGSYGQSRMKKVSHLNAWNKATQEFNHISPLDLENILEWLQDRKYLSDKGGTFRTRFWNLFIKTKY